ncbi:hypothetical protein HZB07_00530 [Candidatus Saganbacteria bacterium]|nr:hypothetical protein [Candidatus Saganbacteria bacterium]
MNRKELLRRTLLIGFVFLSLGGWLLHLRIHQPFAHNYNLIPYISGIISLFVLTLLFSFRKTVAYAYAINGILVIIGTIVMAHFSVVNFKGPLTLSAILLNTLLADIFLLWGKLVVGKAIFDLEILSTDQEVVSPGRYFRYPNMGWWYIHLVALSIVYILGNILWK